MDRKKRSIAWLLIAVLALSSLLAGCGQNSALEEASTSSEEAASTSSEEAASASSEEAASVSGEMQEDIIEQAGVTQTPALYPAAISADMSAQKFLESEEHWNWWSTYVTWKTNGWKYIHMECIPKSKQSHNVKSRTRTKW